MWLQDLQPWQDRLQTQRQPSVGLLSPMGKAANGQARNRPLQFSHCLKPVRLTHIRFKQELRFKAATLGAPLFA